MDATMITKIIKAGLSLLAISGIEVAPEHQQTIIEAVIITYGLLSAIEAKVKHAKGKRREIDG